MNFLNIGIPTIMFHALSYEFNDPFYLRFLSDYFDSFIRTLVKSRVTCVTVEDMLKSNIPYGKSCVCLTFDDGFEDNYHVLFPILKKYNVSATIFISTDFLVDNHSVKPIKDSKWIRSYLSKEQILEMHRSGLVDFQSHSATHTWFPTSGRILQSLNQNSIEKYYWIYWNKHPKEKASVMLARMEAEAQNGFAVYENSRALNCRRFIPDIDEFGASCMQIGSIVSGRLETVEEQYHRYENEILQSKVVLEDLLEKKTDFFCWPGGEFDEISWGIYSDSTYSACSLPSNSTKLANAINVMGDNASVLKRMSSSTVCRGVDLGPRELFRRLQVESNSSSFVSLKSKILRWTSYLTHKILGVHTDA